MSLDLYLVKEEPVLASWFAQPSCGRCGVRLSDKEPFATCAQYSWWVNSILPKHGEVVIVKARDGTLYRFVPSPDAQHHQKSPEDAPEPVAMTRSVIKRSVRSPMAVLWHILAKGQHYRTVCGQTIPEDWALVAWPNNRCCLKCLASIRNELQ